MGTAKGEQLRDVCTPPRSGRAVGGETLTTSGVCGEEMRPPQERAANRGRMEFRDPAGTQGKDTVASMGRIIIISAEVKHSGGSVFHLLCLGACEEGGGLGACREGLVGHVFRGESGTGRPSSARSFSSAGEASLLRACSLWGLSGRGGEDEERPGALKR